MTAGLRAVAIPLTVGLAVSACAGQSAKPSSPAPQPVIPYSDVWSADPGIDLFSRGAELIRATMEAAVWTTYVGVDKSYPGYANAVAALTDQAEGPTRKLDSGTAMYVTRQPDNPNRKIQPHTSYQHITAFTETDTKVSAIVCGYAVGPEQLPYKNPLYIGGGVRIELESTNWDKGSPGIANRDPGYQDPRAQLPPQWDVFGKWKVTTIKAPEGASQYAAECLPWYQEQFPTFTKVADFNQLVSPQGYVQQAHPVSPEFPEWIGPSSTG